MDRKIIHIDMNAYFASVEQVCNPALRGKPVAVCGEGRTIIVTSSYEARKYGVETGMTLPEAKKLCPKLILVIGNHEKYIDTSLKIHKILLGFTNLVEVFSIDECFVDVTGIDKFSGGPVEIAKKIKQKLKEELGLTCSIGISSNKLLAKLASGMQKPDGLVEIKKENVPRVFEKLPAEDLCGIGRKMKVRLEALGIKTAKQLGDTPLEALTGHFGFIGRILKNMGQGIDSSKVKPYLEEEQLKSVGHSHTLPKDTRDLEIIKSFLMMLSEKTGTRMRKYKLAGRTVSLVVRYCDFYTFSKQHSIRQYINSGPDIYNTAYRIFEGLLPLKKPVRLLGVSVSSLVLDSGQQFIIEGLSKIDRLMDAADAINSKYGEFTIKPASVISAEKFGILERCGLIGKYLMNK